MHFAKCRCLGWLVLLSGIAALSVTTGAAPPAAPEKINAVLPLPEKAPAWIDGYRIRWPLRVIGDLAKQKSVSVIASLPTGGWLKPDASDVVVQTAAGEIVPVNVLSHDPAGE